MSGKSRVFPKIAQAAEIEKRKQIAALKLAAYNKAKDELIQPSDPNNKPQVYNRDKSIATFQAILAARGPGGLAEVLKGMSYEDDTYDQTGQIWFNTYPRGDQPGLDEPAIWSDWISAKGQYGGLNPADKALLDEFRQRAKDGTLSSGNYGSFKSAADEELRKKEAYHESIIRFNWAVGVGTPLIISGGIFLGVAYGFFGAAAAAFASFFGAWAGPGLMALGLGQQSAGYALIAAGLALIIPATIDMNNKNNDHNSAVYNTNNQRDAIVNKLNIIKQKEEEYLAAQAAVDYFTKAPSQQVLKDRLVQWGSQNTKYQITDSDLRFIRDTKSNYVDSTGVTYTAGAHCPPTGNCANDGTRASNITSLTETPEFATAAGDLYDPSQTTTQNLESSLQGGFYWLNGERYVKIKAMSHNGQMTDTYAKYITAPIAAGGAWDTYDLGRVMNLTSNHTDNLRSTLKQNYLTAGTAHEQTLMLNEREKTMWSIWDYADAQGKQFKGFQVMAGDYQENSTNVFQTQQQQNASLVTQQWDLRRAELDAARARWENLATTIENRGTESFNASEQKFLKAWRQWEIDTNRKIDAGKKQWDDKIKTFLVSKQNWQEEIKAAAMEQSLEKMLGATGSALNDRLRALSSNIQIPVDVPELNITDLVASAMADFDRNKPSSERIFGEINKSISAFNTTLELGNATHFKGFNSTTLEGDFASNMETFSKKMTILNNVKLYESMKKMIEDFKESLRKNDENVKAGLTTAAVLANYRQDGGWYTKDMGWAFGGVYGFSAYQHADVDAMMNRGMKEAGMTVMSGEEMVAFLQNGREVDVKLFFEVQTMALEQAFKIVGGDRGKKGLYGEWVGEAPQYNSDGDESNQGSGELGGWTGGQMDNKKTYRGLNKEEKRLGLIQGTLTAAMKVTASLAAAATGNVAMLVSLAATQAVYSTGSAISSGRDAGGSLAMGAIDFGIAFGGALMGPGVAATAIRSGVNFVRAGIAQNPDGTINLDFKGNWSNGGGASAAFSGAMSVLGEAAGGSVGASKGEGWGAVVSGAFSAIGSGMRFNSSGLSGFSVASAIGSGIGSAVSYGLNPGNTKSEWNYGGKIVNQILSSEIGKAAEAVTTTILGAAMNDSRAANELASTYNNSNGFSTMGGLLGRVVKTRISDRAAEQQPQVPTDASGVPMGNAMSGAAAQVATRRRDFLDDVLDVTDSVGEKIGGAFTAATNWTKQNLLDGIGNAFSSAASATWDWMKGAYNKTANFLSENVGQRLSNLVEHGTLKNRAELAQYTVDNAMALDDPNKAFEALIAAKEKGIIGEKEMAEARATLYARQKAAMNPNEATAQVASDAQYVNDAPALQKPSAAQLGKALKAIKKPANFAKELEKLEAAGVDVETLRQLGEDYKKKLIIGDAAQLTKLYKFLERGNELIAEGEYEAETAEVRSRVKSGGRYKDRTEEYKAYLYGMEDVQGLQPGKMLEYVNKKSRLNGAMRYRSAIDPQDIAIADDKKIDKIPWTRTKMHPPADEQPGEGDFNAPRGTPLSIMETDDGFFTVTDVGINETSGLYVTIKAAVSVKNAKTGKIDSAVRTIQVGHLDGQLPEALWDMAQLPKSEQKPVRMQAGDVFGYVGTSGNHGTGSGSRVAGGPNAHTHIWPHKYTSYEMPAWLKRMVGIPYK